ncbi:MAG: DUF4355 domain-containing protein [Bacillota bacterium]|nr:DUF4355 domain-containing protein [Bacillota bacterium]
MLKSELIELLNEVADDADIDENLKGVETIGKLFEKGLSIDQVKTFLESDETGKQYLQSYADTKVTKGIQSWKDNNLNKLVQAELLKQNPSKTPEQLQIEELTKRFEEEQQQRKLSEQKSKLKDELREKNVDPRIIDLLINKDEDITRANVALYLDANKNYVQKEVENRIKDGQYTPPGSETDKAKQLEEKVYKAMGIL